MDDSNLGVPKKWKSTRKQLGSNKDLKESEKRLGRAKALWAEELLNIIWAYHCTPQMTIGETPFRLALRTNAMILVEVGESTIRRSKYNPEDNDGTIQVDLDLIE
ncbi:hypothetical protein CR513_30019, partial [Mucuna pruriens]